MNIIETNLQFGTLSKRNSTRRLIMHHSGVTVLQSVETIHNYHKNSCGYSGIGYHFYVRKDGSVYRGRPEDTIGAHAYGANNDSIGVCAEGNFNEETMSEVQKNSIKELVAYLKAKYGVSTVIGHRDTIATSCPGNNYPLQEIANATETKPSKPTSKPTKSVTEVANEVIQGKYGNNPERKARLEAEGYNYNEVQAEVNRILLGEKPSNKKSNEQIADEVIKGLWGNNPERKQRLTEAGYDYNAIQDIVNRKLG